VQRLIKLRQDFPVLRRSRFLTGVMNEELGVKDVTWINAGGSEMEDSQWADANMRCFAMMLDGRAQPTGIKQRGIDATLLLVLNAHHDVVNFTMPGHEEDDQWTLLVDTNVEGKLAKTAFAKGDEYAVTARSLLLFHLHGGGSAGPG
jgi:glycogen operon protein